MGIASGWRHWSVGVACGLAVAAALASGQVYRGGIELVQVSFTVKDRDGRLVTGLDRKDFTVYEDGIEQKIAQFMGSRVPVSLGILVDISDSMFGERMADARRAIDRFVVQLLDAGDEVFLMTFNHNPELVARWTQPPRGLAGRLDTVRPWGGTALYDAILRALPLLDMRRHQRCGLLIISDGADTASDASLQEVRREVSHSDAFVYAIAIAAPTGPAIARVFSPQVLHDITGPAGGYAEVIHTSSELAAAAERIATELNHQYTLAYAPTHGADGAYHTIRVRAADPDLIVRARRGYYATARQRLPGAPF